MTSAAQDWRRSLVRQAASQAAHAVPGTFELAGKTWDVLPGVFSPSDSPSTAALLGQLEFPVGADFLEVGCGTGVVAVSAALAGCRWVLALDLAPEATRNAELNAQRHRVEDRLDVRLSNMFDAIGRDERFDMVFWHSNVVWAPETHEAQSAHELAYVDPGYASHRAFFEGLGHVLKPTGRAVLGLSSRGDLLQIRELARTFGYRFEQLSAATRLEGGARIEYLLMGVVADEATT